MEAGRVAAGRADHHEVVVYVPAAIGPRPATGSTAAPDGDLGVVGDAATVAAALRQWVAAGAGTIALLPTADEPEDFVRFAADEVRPLLSAGPNRLTNGRQ